MSVIKPLWSLFMSLIIDVSVRFISGGSYVFILLSPVKPIWEKLFFFSKMILS